MRRSLEIAVPENFSFQNTVNSHGWSELLPFEFDRENCVLSYVFAGSDNETAHYASISDAKDKLKIEVSGAKTDDEKIIRAVRHILRLDDDLSGFYKILEPEKRLAWIKNIKAGRLLRSPTVYEDLVKTICTTNCSWSLTKKMTANLVEKLGTAAANGKRSFPTARQMADVPAEFYRDEIRAGYRAPYLFELAEKVAAGTLDPESWLGSDLPPKELKKEIKSVKGVGDYAAENLFKLIGNYEGLALDSWVRAQFYKKHNHGEVCEDRQIREFYEKFGTFRGLVLWCDLTERWHG